MKQNFKRKLLAGLLSACMMFQTAGMVPVYAVENAADSGLPIGTSSVCTHHVHDDKCGYTEGTPCTFDTATCESCKAKNTADNIVTLANEVYAVYDGSKFCAATQADQTTPTTTEIADKNTITNLYVMGESVPDNLIGDSNATNKNTNLKTVTCANTVITIGKQAFKNCTALTSVTMPNVTTIGQEAFKGCANLTSVTMPNATTIGDKAFNGCAKLASLTLGETPPATVGTEAFLYCPNSRTLTIQGNTANSEVVLAAYKAAADGDTTDDKWWGWTLPTTMVATPSAGTLAVTTGNSNPTFGAENAITLTATFDKAAKTGKQKALAINEVEFKDGANTLGAIATATQNADGKWVATITTNTKGWAAGAHNLTATFAGNNELGGATATLAITVVKSDTTFDVSSTGVDLGGVKENTTYKAGTGTIRWEPTLDASNNITSGKLSLTDATITTSDETINGAIGLPYECAIELVVNGTNAVSHTGDRSAINGTAIALTMTGNGTLTTDGNGSIGIDVGELSEGQQVPNIADTVRLNGLLVYIKESRAYLTVYGSVTFAKTWSLTADDFTVDKKATLTVPGGVIMRFMNSTNSRITFTNNGTWTNNGTVKLPNTTPAGDIPNLKLTGTGKVNISDFYNNEGVLLPHFSNTPLDFSAATADAGNLTDDGYEWKKDTQTLTLKNLWLEVSKDGSAITLPDDAKLVLQGTSTVIAKNSAICAKGNLTVSGADGILKAGGTSSTSGRSIEATGTLTVDSGTILSAGNVASMYANAITIKAGTIDLGTSGMMMVMTTLTISGGMVKTGASIQGSISAMDLNGGTAKTSINITGGTVIANGGNHQPTPFGILAMNGTISITENAVVTATGRAAAILTSDGTITDTGMTAATTPKGGKVVSATVDMPNGNDSTIQMKFTSYTADATLQAEQGMITNACTTVSLAKTQTPPVNPPDSGDSGSGGSSGGDTTPVPKPEPPKTDPGTGNTEVSVPVKPVTKGDTSSATVPEKAVSDAIAAAEKEAAKTGGSSSVTISVDAPKGAKTVETTLPSKSLSAVADGNTEGLKISTPVADLSFDSEALKNIAGMAGKDVKISATQVDTTALTDAQKSQVGDAPVFDFTVTSGDKTISNFNGGTATVSVPYTPKEGENPEFVTVWLLDDAGKLIPIEAKYKDGKIAFETGHFSRYAIGYLPFTDVKSGWAYESIVYAYQNKLFSGVGDNKFAPTANMNRAMLWTVLYRMAGSPDKTETPANWYADAQAWAIANGISDGTNPTGNITREQLATILFRYAKAAATAADMSTFTDTAEISGFAKDSCSWAVESKILQGNAGKLNPKGDATRAEVAAVLRRYVELVIDKATA